MEYCKDGVGNAGTSTINNIEAVTASVNGNADACQDDGKQQVAENHEDLLNVREFESDGAELTGKRHLEFDECGLTGESEQRFSDEGTWMNPRFYPGLIPASGGKTEMVDDKESTSWTSAGGEVVRTINQNTGDGSVEVKQKDREGKLHLVQMVQFNNQKRGEYILQDVHGVVRVSVGAGAGVSKIENIKEGEPKWTLRNTLDVLTGDLIVAFRDPSNARNSVVYKESVDENGQQVIKNLSNQN
jgi:hypothetical protein